VAAAAHLCSGGRDGGIFQLSRLDFETLALRHRPDLSPEQVNQLFTFANLSGSGRISLEEFRNAFAMQAVVAAPPAAKTCLRPLATATQQAKQQRPQSRESERRRRHRTQPSGSLEQSPRHAGFDSGPPLASLVPRILSWLPPMVFLQATVAAAKSWSLSWYAEATGAVIVPDGRKTINEAINAAADGPAVSVCNSRSAVVFVRPGVYSEAVRVARTCVVCGVGPNGAVIVEAPACEGALGFVGEQRARVVNLTLRCRVQAIRGQCVNIPAGSTMLEACCVEGSVVACGATTVPRLLNCVIRGSPSSGLRFSDGCCGEVRGCTIEGHKLHGVLAERGAQPRVHECRIADNGGAGIRLNLGQGPGVSVTPPNDTPANVVGNELVNNAGGDVSMAPGFIEGEDEDDGAPLFDLFS